MARRVTGASDAAGGYGGRGLWTRGRVLGAAAGSAVAPFALLVVLHFTVGQRSAPASELPAAIASSREAPLASASASASAAAAATTEPVAALEQDAGAAAALTDGGASADAAVEWVDGLDGPAWRKMLRNTSETSDWKRGGAAILALSRIEPAALTRPELIDSTVRVAAHVEAQDPPLADEVYDALSTVPEGLDVLYRLVSVRGGSKAALRAGELLKRDEVRQRGSPALRVALELRDAPCTEKEAIAVRAADEGDHRALVLLLALKSPECDPWKEGCCLRESPRVETAVRNLAARLRPPGVP